MNDFRVFGRASAGDLPGKSLGRKEPVLALRATADGVEGREPPGNWLSAHRVDPVRLKDPNDLAFRVMQESLGNREPRPGKELRVETTV